MGTPRDTLTLRRNMVGFIGEVVFFYLGMVFASMTTVLPGFVSQLTPSVILIGLVLTLAEGASRLPQLLVAYWLSPKRKKKSYLTRAAIISRPAYFLVAVALLAGIARWPSVTLFFFFFLHFILYAALSIDSLIWWDVFAKAIPLHRRGRVLGTSTAVQGVLSIGAGGIVVLVLGSRGPSFPGNYALLFALSSLCLLVSLSFWLLVREPVEVSSVRRLPWKSFVRSVMDVVRKDRTFRRFLALRLLAGFEGLALGFYVLFALRALELPGSMIGVFAVIQTTGAVVGGALFGWISGQFGNHRVIQIATFLGATAPLIAWVFSAFPVASDWVYAYIWVFFAVGLFAAALFVGFNGLTVELAPPGGRESYVGIFNTASGLVIAWPMIGGWILERTSFAILFGATAGLMLSAHLLSWFLPRQESTVETPQ